jgi:cobalt-zinc-cadmium efflux system membrane fusion protein
MKKVLVEVQGKVEWETRTRDAKRTLVVVALTLASTLTFASLTACERTEQPASSNAATPKPQAPAGATPDLQSRVETMVVEYSPVKTALPLAGRVTYGEDRFSKISSPLQGRVVEVRAKLGDRVKAGDILLVIDSPDISAAYSEYVKEASELEYATRAYELAKDLYENKALPQKDLKQAENDLVKARAEFRRGKERLLSLRVPAAELEKPLAEQKITSRFEMKSPLTGTVVERNITPGQSVSGDPAQVLFTVADLDKLQVVADLYERDLDLVKVGQVAAVTVEAYPGMSFPAVLSAVGDVVDPNTRTIKVRAMVDNEAHKLKPEMFARLNIDVGDTTQFIAVPREAVLEADGKEFVYVVPADNRYVRRTVKTAPASSDQIRILEGLAPGERVVTKGAVLIKGQEAKAPGA